MRLLRVISTFRQISKFVILTTVINSTINCPVSAQGYLHRNGKYIFDGAGNEVILRGIGTGNWLLQEGYMMQTSDVAPTQHQFRAKLVSTIGEAKTDSFYTVWLDSHFRRIDVDSMKSWGFNNVRVAMHYKWFTLPIEKEPVAGQQTWLDKGFTMIDSLLDWCGDNQMYLILDLHGAPGGQGKDAAISDYDKTKPSLWESQANKDKTIALWRKLAERYSDEPWIGGYDLINEPNWSFPNGNTPLWDLLKQITSAIREVDKNHLIFIEGNGFANDYNGLPAIWDDNLAISFHKYWNYNTQESINFAINLRNSRNVPIWMGESGENSNNWFTGLIELLEKNRIGWSWWPVKKPGINNPLRVTVNSDYTNLVNFWKGTAANPGVDAAFKAVLQFAINHRLENCYYQRDVVDAMIRQPHSTETIPFKIFKTGEPIFGADYNLGRTGFAYFDNDTANFHGSTNVYTAWNQGWGYRNDGVDIEICKDSDENNGFNVGWTGNNEWMEYTVEVDSTAAYTLNVRSASGSGGSKIRLEIRGQSVTPVIQLPGTSGWQRWQTSTYQGVILEKGINKIKLIFDQGGSNLNYFSFSTPVEVEELAFKNLYAETSNDGKTVFLTLNKPVTSPNSELNISEFTVTINNNSVEISEITIDDKSSKVLVIKVNDPLFYGGTIKLSYNGNNIFSDEQALEMFSNLTVANKLPVRYNLPGRIQSENYYYNNGMVSETCTDTGGGFNMGYANPGDYLDYLVYVPSAGNYKFNFRVASERSSSQIIIRVGEGNSFTAVDTVAITGTGGWQTWKTISSTAFLPEGRYTLRIYVRSGEFNTNWFEAAKAPITGIETDAINGFRIYPNPANDKVTIETGGLQGGEKIVTFYNANGQIVQTNKYSEPNQTEIDISNLSKGLYFVEIKAGNGFLKTAKLVVW